MTTLTIPRGIDQQAHLMDLATRMLRMRNNEQAVTLMLRVMLTFNDLEKAWGLPKIERHRFEFAVPGGRIDLLLFHVDGSVTIVEAKAENGAMQISAGIGQLCMYAALLPTILTGPQKPTAIRRLLCAPIDPQDSLPLLEACKTAGVQLGYLPSFATFKQCADSIRRA